MIYSKTASITLAEIQAFGAITGDNQPIHSVKGICQAGLIVSLLPKWAVQIPELQQILALGAMTVALESKFKHPIMAMDNVTVTFEIDKITKPMLKLQWKVTSNNTVHCEGLWKIILPQ
jgi:acyl dehydratase